MNPRHALLAAALVVAAIPLPATAADIGGPAGDDGGPGPVYVTSADIVAAERDPAGPSLVISGDLPTPCHELAFEVQDLGDRIDVMAWSVADPEAICIQVLEPFEATVPLADSGATGSPVYLNGELVGTVGDGDLEADGPELVGAGWSYGFCAGFCRADLVIEGDSLRFEGRATVLSEPMWTNLGRLTDAGREALARSLEGVDPATLQDVYGCPDCADGGAAHVRLRMAGVTTDHEMPLADPPAELAEVYAVSQALLSALETCAGNELVTVDEACRPYEG